MGNDIHKILKEIRINALHKELWQLNKENWHKKLAKKTNHSQVDN